MPGITMFMVEKDAPGFRVSRALDKMGWRSSDTAELSLDCCRVPEENVLGDVDHGFYAVMKNFQNERILPGAQAMGEAGRAIEMTLDYVRQRKAFGGPLWDKQAVQQRLAQRAAEVEAGRQLVYHAAWLDAYVKEVSMVKAYCGELVNRLHARGAHRAHGLRCPDPVHRRGRDRGDAPGSGQAPLTAPLRVLSPGTRRPGSSARARRCPRRPGSRR